MTRVEVLSGRQVWQVSLRLGAYLAKRLLQRKKYPLLCLNAAKGGLRKTRRIQRDSLGIKKIVRYGDRIVFSIVYPFFPSDAFDHMVAGGGLNLAASGTPLKKHVETAVLAITQRCSLGCAHCYERFSLSPQDSIPVERWKEVVKELQSMGTGIITFSGGEPMERYEALLELLDYGDKSLSDFHLYTSGYGVTPERARALKRSGLSAAGVGLDDVDPGRHDVLRGHPGSHQEAVQSVGFFQDAGVFTYLNLCLTKTLVRSGALPLYLEMARDLGVGFVRLLEPSPCGGYFFNEPDELFSEEDRRIVADISLKMNAQKQYRSYPVLAYLAFQESPENLGCQMGGLVHFSVDGLGNVLPCVFLPVSFGNIQSEAFSEIYARMRQAVPFSLRQGCPARFLNPILKQKYEQLGRYPISHSEIRAEWGEMFGSASG